MMQTSGDILNFSIAVAVLVVAFFLSWLLFYLINSFRRVYKITDQAKKIGDKIENLVDGLGNKVRQSGTYFFAVSRVIDRAMDYFERSKKKSKTATEKKADKVKKETPVSKKKS